MSEKPYTYMTAREDFAKLRENTERLAKIAIVVHQGQAGEIPAHEAVKKIQDISHGDYDPIVRVGGPHRPEVQT